MRPLLALAPVLGLLLALPGPAPDDPAPYVRLVEEDGGEVLRLELAARTLVPAEGDGPKVLLVSVMHIGEASYYAALQRVLDARDVVLFEQVGGDLVAAPEGLAPAARARVHATARRLRALARAVERRRRADGALPEDLAVLVVEGEPAPPLVDAWDRAIELRPTDAGFDLVSLGADGAPGGEGAAADLALSDQPPLGDAEVGEGEGLQLALAEALGLVFQLDAVDYGGARWRNSDMSYEELEAALAEAGVGGGADSLLAALDGGSFLARAGGFLLKLLGSTDEGRGAMKLVGIEVLARADELLAAAPGDMGELLEVLIARRNDVVLRDLAAVVADEPEVRSVAVFYGAGHMIDLERRVVRELGYEVHGEAWFEAVRVDLETIGMPLDQVRFLRRTIQRSLDAQLGD